MRRFIACLLAAALLAGLTGCGRSSKDIENYSFALLLGIDKGDLGQYMITVRLPTSNASSDSADGSQQGNPSQEQNGSEKEQLPPDVLQAQGDSITSALTGAKIAAMEEINYFHIAYIIFSQELAQEENFFAIVTQLYRSKLLKQNAQILICDGKAGDLICKLRPVQQQRLSKAMESLRQTVSPLGVLPNSDLHALYHEMLSPYLTPLVGYAALTGEASDEPAAVFPAQSNLYAGQLRQASQNPVQVYGGVLLDSKKMLCPLTGYETQLLMICRNVFNAAYLSYTLEGLVYDFYIELNQHTQLGVDISGEKPRATVRIRLQAQSQTLLSTEELTRIQELLEQMLASDIETLLKRAAAFGADPIGLGGALAKRFPTIEAFEAYDYTDRLTDFDFDVQVEITLRNASGILY